MIPAKDIAILSISDLTKSIKTVLESQYRFVHVQGEVSNLHIPYSGHLYFTLKDPDAQIRAVLFKGQRQYLAEDIVEGQSIICHGRVSVYEPRGEYQIIIDTVDFKGLGSLQLQFERLKKQLADEGLFRSEAKKRAPFYPEQIFLVTSPTGAAVHDFIKITEQRSYKGKISIFPVTVQGKSAAKQIVEAINIINDSLSADLIILLRGGGTLEDLWAFNEEIVARAIFSSRIPIVTGIGHETDVTIADLCADLHSHTPTAAAEATIPDCRSLLLTIASRRKSLCTNILKSISNKEDLVRHLRRIIGDLDLYIANRNLKLDYLITALTNGLFSDIGHSSSKIDQALERLYRHSPFGKITMQQHNVQYLRKQISHEIFLAVERKQNQLEKLVALIYSVGPLSVLARGYSVVSRDNKDTGKKEIIKQSDQVETGDSINIRMERGSLVCQVTSKR